MDEMAGLVRTQALQRDNVRQGNTRVVGGLAGLCCALSLGIALAACGVSGLGEMPAGRSYEAANLVLAHRMVPVDPSKTATAAASETAAASATAAATTPTPTATTVPTATAAATATLAATATTAATATSATTATVAGSPTTGTAPGSVSGGDNGNFLAGVVLIGTGALLLVLLIVGLAVYLLVWRRRSASGVLLERPGYTQPDDRQRDGYGGYGDPNGYDGPGGYDEPTVPYDDGGRFGGPGEPGGWPTPGGAGGGRGYGDPYQRGGGASGSRGGDARPRR